MDLGLFKIGAGGGARGGGGGLCGRGVCVGGGSWVPGYRPF